MADVDRAALGVGIRALLAARPEYERARDYYSGDVDEVFGSRFLARLLRRAGEKYRLDFAAVPVDVVTDKLEIAAVTVPDDDALTERLNDEVWDANDLLNEFPELIHMACKYGDSYLIVWPDPEDDSRVMVDVNDPCLVRAIYDPENSRKMLFAVKMWDDEVHKIRRANVYYVDRIERFVQPIKLSPSDENAWGEYTGLENDEESVIPNPWDRIPVFHARTSKPYGTPQHKRAYGPQDAINKLNVGMMVNSEYVTTPQRYALADPETDTDDDGGDDFLADDNTSAQVSGNPGSGLKAGPGSLWFLKGTRSVGQFDPSDPDGYLKPLTFQIRAMAQLTRTPMHYFDPMGDVPSGESLRAANAPLNKRVGRLQQIISGPVSGAMELALIMLGANDETHVDVRWTPPDEIEDADGWNVVLLKIKAGVPVKQALMEAGYTDEQVSGWLANTDEQDLRQRIELLAELGAAVRDLGTGVSLGVLDQGAVAGVVDTVLNPIKPEGE